MSGEECEGAEIRGIRDVDWYAQSSAEVRDLGGCGELEDETVQSTLSTPTRSILSARCDKYSVYYTIHLRTSECCQVLILETPLQPLYFASLDTFRKAVVEGGIFGRKQYWLRTNFY